MNKPNRINKISAKTTGLLSGFRKLYLFDQLIIIFLILTALISFLSIGNSLIYLQIGLLHTGLSLFIWWMNTRNFRNGFWGILRFCYPVLIIGLIHYEVEPFLHLFYGPGFSFDSIVRNWDAAIFGNPHLTFHKVFTSPFWVELFHFFYMTYYPILIGSIIWVWKKRNWDFERFAFIYTGIFINFIIIYLIFPVFGPLDFRTTLFNEAGYLPEVVDFLFAVGAPDGAAFPSSHVGQSIGIFLLLRPLKREMAILLSICITGIAISMVYMSIHYAIDAAAGFISGWIFYHVWSYIYVRLKE